MNVRLEKLTLIYFKGKQRLEVNFNYPETLILGENGTGKSTVSDAWHWLLFGKDSVGRSVKTATSDGFELKTLTNENEVIPSVDHEVIGELYCDNRKVTLRKIYREDWVKPRGAITAVLKGHTNVCYFDGVPVDMGEYNRRINDIIPEALFKLITNPMHYNSLHWQERRKVLINMAGNISDIEIAALHPEFQMLLESLEGKSLADFKAKIGAEKATIKKEFDLLPTKISTVREGMAEVQDWVFLESEIARLQTDIDGIDIAIGNASESYKTVLKGVQEKQLKINELKTTKQNAIQKARTAEQNRVFEANQKRRELENVILGLKRELSTIQTNVENLIRERDIVQGSIDRTNLKISNLRNDWSTENSREYKEVDGCLTCPIYEHECTDAIAQDKHAGSRDKARETFNAKKKEKLADINKEGSDLSAKIPKLQEQIDGYNRDIEKYAEHRESKQKDLDFRISELELTPIEQEKTPIPETLPDWVSADSKIKEIEETITEINPVDNIELIQQKRGIVLEIDALKKRLNTKENIESDERRIDQYTKSQQEMAQQISDLESQEYQVMQFTKAKFAEVENRINSKFKLVKFKLFNYTTEGNEVEVCETLVDGVPFSSANTAGRINAGLDIINALCEYYGYTAPIFIDNRESVNDLIPCESQIINLIVTKDKNLIIN